MARNRNRNRNRNRLGPGRREHLEGRAEDLAAAAAAPAEAAIHDQIQDTRRDVRGEVRSQHSMAAALTAALEQARHSVGGMENLTPEDRRMLKTELIQRIPDVAAGEAYGVRNARREGGETIEDLRSDLVDVGRQEGLDTQAALTDLIEAAKDRKAEKLGERADRQENQAEHHRAATKRENAHAQELEAAMHEGRRLLSTFADQPPESDEEWATFEGLIGEGEGVNDPRAAATAARRLRRQLEAVPAEGEIGHLQNTAGGALADILRGVMRR